MLDQPDLQPGPSQPVRGCEGVEGEGREERRVLHAGQEGQQRGQGRHQDSRHAGGRGQGAGPHLGCDGWTRWTGQSGGPSVCLTSYWSVLC